MRKKFIIILCAAFLVVAAAVGFFILNKEEGIKIDEAHFPEETLRKIAAEADKNQSGILSVEEAESVKEIYLKKLYPQDVIDIFEYDELPSYTDEDFTFDFEGIQYFYNAKELTINLADGEHFNKDSDDKQIYVESFNFERIYELKSLESLCFYEVGLREIDIQSFPKLKKLKLQNMYNMEEIVFPEHTTLKEVWVMDTDAVKSIDFSKLTKLKKAHIRYNYNLTSISFGKSNSTVKGITMYGLPMVKTVNLSLCESLEKLNISEVPIENLDLSANKNLVNLSLAELNLATLDLTSNLNISELCIDCNAAGDVILDDNNKIAWVIWINSSIENLPIENLNPETLVGLDIQGTKIKEIDISPYYNLETVYFDEGTTVVGDVNGITE